MTISQSIILFIVSLFIGLGLGVDMSRTVIQKDCDAFGKFRLDKAVFICAKERQQ